MPRKVKTKAAAAVLLAMTWTSGPALSSASAAAPLVTQDRLAPATATAGTVPGLVTVHANRAGCLVLDRLTLAVRDAKGANLDFPGTARPVVCGRAGDPDGYTYQGVRNLAAGTYTVFGAYQYRGSWYDLPAKKLTVRQAVPPGSTTSPPAPSNGGTTVLSAPFDDTATWTVGKSSAYPGNGPTNRNDDKLDYISPVSAPQNGVFDAKVRNDGTWATDFVTTEYSSGGFKVKTGDTVTATVTLGSDQGAWPAIWTWGDGSQAGHGEVDLFEYHPDNPRLLELSNHLTGNYKYVDNIVQPGTPFTISVYLGATHVDWRINGSLVFSDTAGLPASWSAYLIVNLSVGAGTYHPAPTAGQSSMSYHVADLTVIR